MHSGVLIILGRLVMSGLLRVEERVVNRKDELVRTSVRKNLWCPCDHEGSMYMESGDPG